MRYDIRQVTHTSNKLRTGLLTIGSFAALTTAYLCTLQPAEAATPSDTCFAFSSGTITGYYANENNDPGQPACPKDVDIPSTIGGVPVTTIADYGFAGQMLTQVTIPNSVLSIGEYSFVGNQLTSVDFGQGVQSIGSTAFAGNQLTSVTLPNSVTTLGNYVIAGNPVTSVTIGTTDFSGTPQLIINQNCFGGVTLTDLHLGNTVVQIGTFAFAYHSLVSVSIPDSVTLIREGAFSGNTQLTSLSLGNSVATIEYAAFANAQITSLTVPDSVQTIGDAAFVNNQLETVVIPNSVTTIGSSSFSGNPLRTVSIGTSDFSGTAQLVLSPSMGFYNSGITTLQLGANIKAIESGAFYNNSITSLTIPSSVESIDNDAFGTNPLQTVTIEGNPVLGVAAFFRNYDSRTIPSGLAGEDLAVYRQATLHYLRIYAANPTFVAAYGPGHIDIETYGSTTYTVGGYIVSPATYTVHYESTDGDTLAPAVTSGAGPTLADYSIAANPTGDFNLYYRMGDTVPLTAPAVTGYTTPAAHVLSLNPGANQYAFVYTAIVADNTPSDNSDSATDSPSSDATAGTTSTPALASTGSNQFVLVGLGIFALLTGGFGLYTLTSRRR